MNQRIFLAIDLPGGMKKIFSDWQAANNHLLPARFIPAENMHITLVFLGSVASGSISALTSSLDLFFRPIPVFRMVFDSIIWAPFSRDYAMIWASFRPDASFEALVINCRLALKKFVSLADAPRPWPHVTLARLQLSSLRIVLPPLVQLPPPLPVRTVSLFSSTLAPTGSVYKKLASFQLLGR